jgi:hypothetical protein
MRTPLIWSLCLALSFAAGAARSQEDVRNAAWPSLDRQLEIDRVVSGSALQRLIQENQDFRLLRPEEARDTIPVPPWLRVLWRKQHPELTYRAGDPAGGYPHVLKEIHEWMLAHQDLLPGFTEPEVLPGEQVSIGTSERRISSPSNIRSESDIRINFWDPARVIAASNNISGSGQQSQYWSTDGGQSWGETTLPLVTQDDFHSDPTVEWTSDGTAWSATIGITGDGNNLRLRLYRSTNNGATWVFDSTISGSQTATDKQMIWIDHSVTSPNLDTMYVIWHNGAPVYMNRKKRNGTWGTPIKVSGSETTGTGIGADVKTNSAGVVFAFWPDTGSRKIYMVKSTNGGQSYSKPKAIASTFDSYDIGVPAMNGRRVLIYATGATYKAAGKDLVYVVWADLTGATGCRASNNEPGGNAASACKTRIWFTRSTDGGATWSAKKMINNTPGKSDQLNPWLAVDEATGTLAVIYYDTAGESRRKTNLWYQSSYDSGATWTAPFRVTSQGTDESLSSADGGNQYGDYNGLSGYAGTFFPVWTDRRQGGGEQIWTAALLDQPGNCSAPAAPTNLRASVNGNNRIDLIWNAVGGAQEHRIYRGTTNGGPYTRIATVSGSVSSFANTGLTGGATYYYVVRAAVAGCESGNSNQASAKAQGSGGGGNCSTLPLYSSDFENLTNLGGWTRGIFTAASGTADWRGVQSCAARSGSKIYRFGGTSCTSHYGGNTFAFAQPGGNSGISVPAGSTQVRLSFWHRFSFEDGADGGLIAVSLDGANYLFAPETAISGFGYSGRIDDEICPQAGTLNLRLFTGQLNAWSNTTVNLDAICNAITGGSGGCAGRLVRIGFTTITDCAVGSEGWFLDDVQVSACVP